MAEMRKGDPVRGFRGIIAEVADFDHLFGRLFPVLRYPDGRLGPGPSIENYEWREGAWDLIEDDRPVFSGRD